MIVSLFQFCELAQKGVKNCVMKTNNVKEIKMKACLLVMFNLLLTSFKASDKFMLFFSLQKIRKYKPYFKNCKL